MTSHPLLHKTLLLSLLALLAIGVVSLTACGNKEAKPAGASQVAAKVGSEEVSVHQINQVLSHTNTAGATPEQVKALSREVLEKLIDQQIAVDQATEKKLHRSPEVVAEIEAARREILARAFVQSITAEVAKPTPEEVHAYFVDHPQLFTERRVFNVQELVTAADATVAESLQSMVAAGKPMDELVAWLKSKDIRFSGGSATRPAEQLPLESLPKLQALKDGQAIVLPQGANLSVLRVVSSQAAPVTEDAVTPRIQQFLTNQRAMEAVNASRKQLRASTKITYVGEFDSSKPTPDAGAGLIK
jgi:EpsD family peptidyl-prolyl cis-trans isomerase